MRDFIESSLIMLCLTSSTADIFKRNNQITVQNYAANYFLLFANRIFDCLVTRRNQDNGYLTLKGYIDMVYWLL